MDDGDKLFFHLWISEQAQGPGASGESLWAVGSWGSPNPVQAWGQWAAGPHWNAEDMEGYAPNVHGGGQKADYLLSACPGFGTAPSTHPPKTRPDPSFTSTAHPWGAPKGHLELSAESMSPQGQLHLRALVCPEFPEGKREQCGGRDGEMGAPSQTVSVLGTNPAG